MQMRTPPRRWAPRHLPALVLRPQRARLPTQRRRRRQLSRAGRKSPSRCTLQVGRLVSPAAHAAASCRTRGARTGLSCIHARAPLPGTQLLKPRSHRSSRSTSAASPDLPLLSNSLPPPLPPGDLLEGLDMAPLHRCLHIHACLGRLPQLADSYARNRRQQASRRPRCAHVPPALPLPGPPRPPESASLTLTECHELLLRGLAGQVPAQRIFLPGKPQPLIPAQRCLACDVLFCSWKLTWRCRTATSLGGTSRTSPSWRAFS